MRQTTICALPGWSWVVSSRALLCDYSVGNSGSRCPAEATFWRYTLGRPPAYHKTRACHAHRYPLGQGADTDTLYVEEIE